MFQANPYSFNAYAPNQQFNQAQSPMPQLNAMQQAQSTQPVYGIQNVSIQGRAVSSLEDIVPNDVPRDGSIGLFPKNDYSVIYAKQWNGDGSISTIKFVPEIAEDPVDSKDGLTLA